MLNTKFLYVSCTSCIFMYTYTCIFLFSVCLFLTVIRPMRSGIDPLWNPVIAQKFCILEHLDFGFLEKRCLTCSEVLIEA